LRSDAHPVLESSVGASSGACFSFPFLAFPFLPFFFLAFPFAFRRSRRRGIYSPYRSSSRRNERASDSRSLTGSSMRFQVRSFRSSSLSRCDMLTELLLVASELQLTRVLPRKVGQCIGPRPRCPHRSLHLAKPLSRVHLFPVSTTSPLFLVSSQLTSHARDAQMRQVYGSIGMASTPPHRS
jgi:hypothetical protein